MLTSRLQQLSVGRLQWQTGGPGEDMEQLKCEKSGHGFKMGWKGIKKAASI